MKNQAGCFHRSNRARGCAEDCGRASTGGGLGGGRPYMIARSETSARYAVACISKRARSSRLLSSAASRSKVSACSKYSVNNFIGRPRFRSANAPGDDHVPDNRQGVAPSNCTKLSGWSEALKLSRENTVPGKDGMRAELAVLKSSSPSRTMR